MLIESFKSLGTMKVTNHLDELIIYESTAEHFAMVNPRICLKQGMVVKMSVKNKTLSLSSKPKLQQPSYCKCFLVIHIFYH